MDSYRVRSIACVVAAFTAGATMAPLPTIEAQIAMPGPRAVGVPVTIANPPTSPVPVAPIVPPTQFSIPTAILGEITQLVRGDPPGTRYAITSVVLTNPCCEAVSIRVFAQSGPGAPGSDQVCPLKFGESGEGIDRAFGPELIAPRGQTVALTFPQPFVTAPLGGGHTCLSMSSSAEPFGPQDIFVVGYKL